jgi:hypothetical protein
MVSNENLSGAFVSLADSHAKLTDHTISQDKRRNQERAETALPPAKDRVASVPAAAQTKEAPSTHPKKPSQQTTPHHNFAMGDRVTVTANGIHKGVTGRFTEPPKPYGFFLKVKLDNGFEGSFRFSSLQQCDD